MADLIRRFIHIAFAIAHSVLFLWASPDMGGDLVFYFFVGSWVFLFASFGHDRVLAPLLLFASTYVIYLFPFFFFGLPYHYLTETQSMDLTVKVFALQHVFYFLWLIPRVGRTNWAVCVPNLPIGSHSLLTLVAFMLIMLAINVSLSPPNFGAAYTGENTSTVWIEYSFPFLIVLAFSRSTERHRWLIIAVLLIYVAYPFLYSRRLQMLMILLLIYYRFFVHTTSVPIIYMSAVGLFVAMRIFESTRMGLDFSLVSLFLTTNERGVEGSNQGGVAVASTVYLYLIESGIFDFPFRLQSLLGNLFTGFLPGAFNFLETYVNLRALEYLPLPGNGGLTAVYFYLWAGLPGVWLFSILLGNLSFRIRPGSFYGPLSVVVLMTFPRLHSYNLLATTKSLTIVLVILLILSMIPKRTPL